MKRVIELPDKVVEAIQNGEDYRYDIHTAIAQSTPYNPSGDAISREALKGVIETYRPALIYNNKTDMKNRMVDYFLDEIDNAEAIPLPSEQIAWEQGYEAGLAQGKQDNAPTVDLWQMRQEATENALKKAREEDKWGKWVITEIRCPNCLEYFDTDCHSTEELKKCPNCGADMRTKENESV